MLTSIQLRRVSEALDPRGRLARRPARGSSVLEWIVVITILAVLLEVGLGGFARLRDGWSIQGARTAVAALVREARSRAVARGGATLTLSTRDHTALLRSAGAPLRRIALETDFGVRLDLGGADSVSLTFDPAGVGRLAARTLHFSRGRAHGRLVISGYGRVR